MTDRARAELRDLTAGVLPRLLRQAPPVAPDFEIETDFERAKELAWSQDVDVVWADLKERRLAFVSAAAMRTSAGAQMERALTDAFESLMGDVEQSIPARFEEIAEEIASDLRACASAALHVGPQPFFDLIRKAYAAGGWPCGWRGAYPEGNLIVFFPAS